MTGCAEINYEYRMLSMQQNWYPASFDVTHPPPYLVPDLQGSPCFSGREQS